MYKTSFGYETYLDLLNHKDRQIFFFFFFRYSATPLKYYRTLCEGVNVYIQCTLKMIKS